MKEEMIACHLVAYEDPKLLSNASFPDLVIRQYAEEGGGPFNNTGLTAMTLIRACGVLTSKCFLRLTAIYVQVKSPIVGHIQICMLTSIWRAGQL
jgi:hypothetical protein